MLAPTGMHKLAHPDGELAVARAAGRAGIAMAASTMSTCSLEEIAAAAHGPLWFQLYVYRDRAITRDLVARAVAAGYRAIVLTADTPTIGRRERDVRNRFTLPRGVTIRNFEALRPDDPARWDSVSSFAAYIHRQFDATLTWESVAWLRSLTTLPIVIKGVLTAEDALRAVDAGARAIVVSNHGGRQLDGADAPIDALPAIADAVGGGAEVLMDGGVRRGVDVLTALALGARAVCIGRPYLYGLAVAGEEGVFHVAELLRAELELAMTLSGRPTMASIDRSLVVRRSSEC
jgi:4-hydroxymandelate oxidase